jgi:catechol 2,3-dioxygenase
MIRTERIGHVVLKVRDLKRSVEFYNGVLGLDVMSEAGGLRMAFLASNRRDHHEIGLIEVGPQAELPAWSQLGLVHIAFRLRNQEDLQAAYAELKERGVPIAFTVNHGITNSVYFLDPDGHQLEVYCDNPPEEVARMRDGYTGMDKLEFAPDDPGLADFFAQMRN